MKTINKAKIKGRTKLASIIIMALFVVGCGKNNTSGKNNDVGTVGNAGIGYGPGSLSHQLPGDWMNIVAQENPCRMGGQRAQTQVQVTTNVNVGGIYVGVSSFGDIAVIQNQGQAPIMTMYICPRQGLTGQGHIIDAPITENSTHCPFGQITKVDVALSSQYGTYPVAFRPIHIPNAGVYSQLCNQNQQSMYY